MRVLFVLLLGLLGLFAFCQKVQFCPKEHFVAHVHETRLHPVLMYQLSDRFLKHQFDFKIRTPDMPNCLGGVCK